MKFHVALPEGKFGVFILVRWFPLFNLRSGWVKKSSGRFSQTRVGVHCDFLWRVDAGRVSQNGRYPQSVAIFRGETQWPVDLDYPIFRQPHMRHGQAEIWSLYLCSSLPVKGQMKELRRNTNIPQKILPIPSLRTQKQIDHSSTYDWA